MGSEEQLTFGVTPEAKSGGTTPSGGIPENSLCNDCVKGCKQPALVVVIRCPNFQGEFG